MSTGRGTALGARAVWAVGVLGAVACGSAGGSDLFESGAGGAAVGTGGVPPSGGAGGLGATSGSGSTGGVTGTGGANPAGGSGGATTTADAGPAGGGGDPAGGSGGAGSPEGGEGAAAGSAGGSSGGGNPTGGTGGCDFDRQTGPCADLRCERCNDSPGDVFCGNACQALIDCVASQPSCSTSGDPLCVIRHPDGMPSACTAPAEMAGGYQSEPLQWALALYECLCSP